MSHNAARHSHWRQFCPFATSDAEVGYLHRFLESLTNHHVAGLISSAREVEVGDH